MNAVGFGDMNNNISPNSLRFLLSFVIGLIAFSQIGHAQVTDLIAAARAEDLSQVQQLLGDCLLYTSDAADE